ncbi:condensin-2 complex subunit G2-like [Halichondria panicea]|uniref:condensin-2 complex subunit G2-like n=1 Tax=Halichondria panicea TaxID=6063 RepID=UPI00312B902A
MCPRYSTESKKNEHFAFLRVSPAFDNLVSLAIDFPSLVEKLMVRTKLQKRSKADTFNLVEFFQALYPRSKRLHYGMLFLDCVSSGWGRKRGWWCTEREDREGLVPHTLLYIVARSLTDGALAADVKRVWSMRQAFLLLDFEDISAEPFKAMLLSATLQPLYINTEEGRKFLSFLFGMHPSFVEDLHQTIKYQIPYMSKEVYLRAWRLSSGPYLRQIEEQCLQDLMFSAVHAPRLGQHSLFNSLRKVSI